ncbi:MAG: ribonuclease P protein component 1 [Candidatus Aenigmatarchaeota archaeon]
MAIKPENLVRHELIGLDARVLESSDPTQVGLSGKVVDETRNTIEIEAAGKTRSVIKKNCVFAFALGEQTVKVDGKILVARPEDRVKKKFDKW